VITLTCADVAVSWWLRRPGGVMEKECLLVVVAVAVGLLKGGDAEENGSIRDNRSR